MLGRLPWFAFERRIRAFFFFVFFDMVDQASGDADSFLGPITATTSRRGREGESGTG
jgi:hypothetical protein